jgi:alpha-D-xyloside xylohydrolase
MAMKTLVLLLCLVQLSAAGLGLGSMKCWTIWHAEQVIQVDTFGSDSLRVRATHFGSTIRDDLPDAFVPSSELPFELATDCTELKTGEAMTSGNLNLTFTVDGLMHFTRVSDGETLLEEARIRTIENTTLGLDGLWQLGLYFKAYAGEHLYGLGQHPHGFLDNKGQVLDLNQRNTQINVPLLHSNRGYSYLFNIPAFGNVSLNDQGSVWHADAVFQLDLWICTTAAPATDREHATYDTLDTTGTRKASTAAAAAAAAATRTPLADRIAKYVSVTGSAPTFPYWASGFWQVSLRLLAG